LSTEKQKDNLWLSWTDGVTHSDCAFTAFNPTHSALIVIFLHKRLSIHRPPWPESCWNCRS